MQTTVLAIITILAAGTPADLDAAAEAAEALGTRLDPEALRGAGQARLDRDWETGGRAACRPASRLLAACTGLTW